MRHAFVTLLLALTGLSMPKRASAQNEIGFVERFALAEDRDAVLQELIPGTEDYYYFHALHFQVQGRTEEFAAVLEQWRQRFPGSGRLKPLEDRQALLDYPVNPAKTLEYLKRELGLSFDHQREQKPEERALPERLDPAEISREAFLRRATAGRADLNSLEDSALAAYIRSGAELSPAQLRELLQRLSRPDFPKLVELILTELALPDSGGFGSLPIHQALLRDQLDALAESRPDLRANPNFVYLYLTRLAPDDDSDLASDADARLAYLERLREFSASLNPAFNSLKASVLYRLLEEHRNRGSYPADLLLAYLELPRHVAYMRPEYLQNHPDRAFAVDLSAAPSPVPLPVLPPIFSDEALVREYLLVLLKDAPDYQAYLPYLQEDWLKGVFAETKIVHGIGSAEQWASLIPPAVFQALKERVDLDFVATNPRRFALDEAVRLELDVKNVSNLIVKIYEINTLNHYLANAVQIGTDLDLDGLVANQERVEELDNANPFLRRRQVFELPAIEQRRGVWMVEFIGNGKSSRALIRRGSLQYLSRVSTAGHVLSVLDENNEPMPQAAVWLGGREFKAGEEGSILIPFSTQPAEQPVILSDGAGFASLERLQLLPEHYALHAGFYVSREQLLNRKQADVVIKPALLLNGHPVTLSVLENVRLTLTSTDVEGNVTTDTVEPFELFEDRESVHRFRVPDRLQTLQFTLSAEVNTPSTGEKPTLSASHQVAINGALPTEEMFGLHLSEADGQRFVHVLGRNGEPAAGAPVRVGFKHRDFREVHYVVLQSSAQGVVSLGELPEIVRIEAQSAGMSGRSWELGPERAASLPPVLHARSGAPLLLAYGGDPETPLEEAVSLLETRQGVFVRAVRDGLTLRDGVLEIAGLDPGTYSLWLRTSNQFATVHVAQGEEQGAFVLGPRRHLRRSPESPLHIRSVDVAAQEIVIELGNAGPFTRVHVSAERFDTPFPLYPPLAPVHAPLESVRRSTLLSDYISGRRLGDEYRYIIDRRYAKRYPGVMAERPGLLLNPWELRSTDTGVAQAQAGEEYDRQPVADAAAFGPAAAARPEQLREAAGDRSLLDFLRDTSVLLYNLLPDENGLVIVQRDQLDERQQITIVAVDPEGSVLRKVSLPAAPAALADQRLLRPLDKEHSYSEHEDVFVLRKGEKLVVDDVRTTQLEYTDTVAKAYRLLQALKQDPTFTEFGFILQWPKLSAEEKREKYSTYASHELNLFLLRKDPGFFEEVLSAYLPNKMHVTFVDEYLIQSDLASFLDTWAFNRLNAAEKALLGYRLGGDPLDRIRRHLRDLLDLQPRPPSDRFPWFSTALANKSLQSSLGTLEDLQLGIRLEEAEVAAESLGDAGLPPAPATAMAGDMLDLNGVVTDASLTAAPPGAPQEQLARFNAPSHEMQAAGGFGFGAERAKEARAYFEKDVKLREAVEAFYRRIDRTKEWAENNYHHLPLDQQTPGLIPVNRFWNDLAAWDGEGNFLSIHFPEATANFAEMLLTLAVLDLPFDAPEHPTETEGTRFTLTAASDMIVFRRHIQQTPKAEEPSPLLLSQNFFVRSSQQQALSANQPVSFLGPDSEFVVSTVYGTEIVATNPSSTALTLDLLGQIPQGAIVLLQGKATQSWNIRVEPYSTFRQELLFYFPQPGSFALYPATAALEGKVVAQAPAFSFNVLAAPTARDTESWDYVSQWGTEEEVLAFLAKTNLHRHDLARIAWRMRDAAFFRRTMDLLEARQVFHPLLASYAVLHNDTAALRSYLKHRDDFLARCGPYLESELVQIDPVERRYYQHLEYAPLINARSHMLGGQKRILNNAFHQQYHQLMHVLAHKAAFAQEDELATCYYLFLQDRTEEALARFEKLDPEQLHTSLQYVYLAAYAALCREQPEEARRLVAQHCTHPVPRWRNRFLTVLNQLDEISGAAPQAPDEREREQSQNVLAAQSPALDLRVEGSEAALAHRNVEEVTVNYYRMDIEFLFSANPFVEQDSNRFSIIKPNLSETRRLDAAASETRWSLPREFAGQNVLVEVVGAGLRRTQAVYSNAMQVQVTEPYGRLQVSHAEDQRPLAKVYVKVYARYQDGSVSFYKDGYTDLRGRFDYTSLSTDDLERVQRFALLVLSDTDGAAVRETAPPQQ